VVRVIDWGQAQRLGGTGCNSKLEDSRLADIVDLPSRIKENISDALQYSSLYWSNHLCFSPDNGDRRVWSSVGIFFEGILPLFWIEVLSIMGMVPIGAPSLRGVISWIEVSTVSVCRWFASLIDSMLLLGYRFRPCQENSRCLSFHNHLPHTRLYQCSTHLYFNGTLPTLTVTVVNHLQHSIY